jgi:hypothetical protein
MWTTGRLESIVHWCHAFLFFLTSLVLSVAQNQGQKSQRVLVTFAVLLLSRIQQVSCFQASTKPLRQLVPRLSPTLRNLPRKTTPAFADTPAWPARSSAVLSRVAAGSRLSLFDCFGINRDLGRSSSRGSLCRRNKVTMSANYKQSNYVPELVDSTITYEDIATFPRPGCTAPDSIFFSLDDSVVTVRHD